MALSAKVVGGLGNATDDKVAAGITYTSDNGIKRTGTYTLANATKDATATAADILTPASAYVDGVKITGTCTYDSDTKDATATNKDIGIGKTAYVNGLKVTGKSLVYHGDSTYAGMYATVKRAALLNNYMVSYENLTGVEFQDCTATNAYRAFYNCKGLKEVVNFPSTVTDMQYSFQDCSSLKTFNAPSLSATTMYQSFTNCTSLSNFDTPQLVATNMANTFKNTNLSAWNTVFAGDIENMANAFTGCNGLISLNLNFTGNTVNANSGFAVCDGLQDVNITFTGSALSLSKSFLNCSNLKNVNITSSGIVDAQQAFQACTNITTANLGNNVSNLYSTFSGCSNLTHAYVGSSVTNLSYTFKDCDNLSYVDIIPSTVTNSVGAFQNVKSSYDIGTLCINNLSTTNSSWKTYLNCVDNYVNSSGVSAFGGATAATSCKGLTRVNNVVGVVDGSSMFQNCTNLTYVNLCNSLDTLSNATNMFSISNNIIDLVGFGTSAKHTFTSLSDFSQIFYATDYITPVDRRISTSYSGEINATYAFRASSGYSNAIINLPNATSAVFRNAFDGSIISNVYINAPSVASANFYSAFKVSSISNIYLNLPDSLSPTLTNCFIGRVASVMTNIYVRPSSTLNTLFYNAGKAPTGIFTSAYTWTLDETNTCYYNTTANIYVYYNLTSLPSDL